MKIQPESHNSIKLEMDDGSTFKLHHTSHGNVDYLFIRGEDGLTIDKPSGLEWKPVFDTVGIIRLSSIKSKEGEYA